MQINTEKCHDCGAEIKSRKEFDRHVNGYWNEQVVFKCGASMEFSPNFMCTVQRNACANSAEQQAEMAARKKLAADIRDLVGNSTCGGSFKELVVRGLPLT